MIAITGTSLRDARVRRVVATAPGIDASTEATDAGLLYLPRHGPFENAFAEPKGVLRTAAERSIDTFSPDEGANDVAAVGCDRA